jgi:type I restriction enzyme S subunit
MENGEWKMSDDKHSQFSPLNSPLIPPDYKQTEVGVIPEDWDIKSCSVLSDLITVGIVIRPTQYYTKQGVPALRSANIREDRIDDTDMVFISEKANALLSKSQVRTGDVLTVRTGYPGTSAAVPPSFAGANCIDILITRPSKAVSSKYLSAWINSPFGKHQVLRNQGGFAQQHFNVSDLRNLVVALPPLAEQEAIAEALSDADALIESLEQLIAKKRQIKQGAMQELLRPRDGWVRKKLGDLASIQRGASPRPIDSPIWFDDNSNVGWVRISDLTRSGMFLRETSQRLSALGIQQSRPVNRGSLIMSICATVGRPIITEIDTCIHDGFVVFEALRADKHFMYYILSSIENDWTKHGQTGSQMNLNTGLINRTEIVLPPPEEQTAIATILSDIDAEIAALEEKLTKAHQLKQGMMQELLTGKTRLVESTK